METRVDEARGNTRLTYAKLYNLGNYENERIEISVETPAMAWGDVISGLAAACDAFHFRILAERKEIALEEDRRRGADVLLERQARALQSAREQLTLLTTSAREQAEEAAKLQTKVEELSALPGVLDKLNGFLDEHLHDDDIPF